MWSFRREEPIYLYDCERNSRYKRPFKLRMHRYRYKIDSHGIDQVGLSTELLLPWDVDLNI